MTTALFILSFRHRDELRRLGEDAGWRITDARRAEGAEARFIGSGARVALVDARGAPAEALAAARALAAPVEAHGAALLLLLSEGDDAMLPDLLEAGATHFLVEPFDSARLTQAVRFAERHADRIAGTQHGPTDATPVRGRRVRDSLTGLQDAASARNWIAARLEAPEAEEPRLILLLLAVSRFDTINAAFGRMTGDDVLQAVARRIARLVEPVGEARALARIAGAEFAVMLAAPASLWDGRMLAAQLVESIALPFMSGEHLVTLGSRVGVIAAEPGDDAATLLRRASAALLEARKPDSGPIRVQHSSTRQDNSADDQLEIDLRRGLDKDEIEILFQPQVAIASNRIVAAEALARWRHPRLGELGANTLFAVAERSDYEAQLSDHVQRKAIEAVAAWPDALGELGVSINITASDMRRPGFAAQLLALIDENGIARDRVTVEMTETGLIEDLYAAAALLARLREGGLRVAVDDFGTGYSSLAYLKALPLDALKIDKRLSDDIAGSERDRIVVRGVIDMARALGLSVVAEGVETEAQLELLAAAGSTLYQGYLCAPPVDSAALAALVAANRAGAASA